MKIGITGAGGQLGRLVVQNLLEKVSPKDVVAVVRDTTKVEDLAGKGVEVRVAAYDDRQALEAALAGLDKVLLVSSSEVGRRVMQHRNVIDAAKVVAVPYVAYTSAPKATTSALVLAPEHKATEEYLTQSGLAFTILRNNWYTENYAAMIETACETGRLVAAVADGKVASAPRADYAAGAAVVLLSQGHDGKVYELSGDSAWDFNDLARTISAAAGKPVIYEAVTVERLVEVLTERGMDDGTARFIAAIDEGIAAGLLSGATPELSKLIGRPTTPLLESVKKILG
jgi:NAD(P)H dehydrogenase (quinone)